ncbi:tRNA-binding protein [Sphingobacterium sp.]|uniref:tRNA-binding protein n=1 Tax=Sphingobacterium sp. TaxID=341027 RepID=UPI0031D45F80
MSNTISWGDFEKVDLRVATILDVQNFPKAKKPAYQLKLDFGDEIGILQSSAQITVHYSKEELIGKQVVAVVNFPKKQIANFFSECLVTGFPDENGDIVLTSVDKKLPNGSKLS